MKPFLTPVVRHHFLGVPVHEIAKKLKLPKDVVAGIISTQPAQELIKRLQDKAFDSMAEVESELQAAAPELLREKIRLALESNNEHIRTRNTNELLQMAGHVPMHRLMIERPDPILEKYRGMDEGQIREELRRIRQAIPVQIEHKSTAVEEEPEVVN